MPIVLVVDDDYLIASDLAEMIAEGTGAEVIVSATVSDAEAHVSAGIDFALLDINLRSQTTFDLARRLAKENVPFAFASGSTRTIIPHDLKAAPFLAKPCRSKVVIAAVSGALIKAEAWRRARDV